MTRKRMTLTGLLRKAGAEKDLDFLRECVRLVAQELMETEVSARAGARKYERTDARATYRNGFRERCWDTRVGTVPLAIPRIREGSYFPSLLEPRRRAEKALLAVVQEAYVLGVSTRKVETLVKTLGLEGISKSEVSRICGELDDEVNRWRKRPLSGRYPYLWLDATYLKVREDGRVMSQAVIVAYAVRETGEREVVGLEIGYSEEGPFWVDFLRSLVERGLCGVQLVVSDAHRGLKEAIDTSLAGASWQRCRVHFMRNALARVPRRGDRALVAAAIRAIFAQPEKAMAREQLRMVADSLRPRFGMVADLLEEAEEDLLAYMSFPPEHWRQLYSTNPLERINKEIKRRSNVVGIFPNQAAVIRLVGALLMEQQDEWEVCRRYFSLESMRKTLDGQKEESLVALLKA